MLKMVRFLPCLLILMVLNLQAQTPVSRVNIKFNKPFLSQNFDSASAAWSTIANTDNLFLMQDGEYILNRKSMSSPFAVMANLNTSLSNFRMVTSMKLVKVNSEEGSLGIIFMAQPGGTGGFILEINKNQQYRLRQITNNAYSYITGTAATGGWVKSEVVNTLNTSNLIDIRCAERNYDIYINNILLTSFTEIAYKSGDIGLLIGPGTKGSVDFIYIFTNEADSIAKNSSTETAGTNDADVVKLAESIISLKTQINDLTASNNDLRRMIETMKGSEKESEQKNVQSKIIIKQLEDQIKQLQKQNDSLIKANGDMQRYKDIVSGNDGGDLVISLSKNLKAAKLANEHLQSENKALRDSIDNLKGAKVNGSNGNAQPNNDSNKKGFSLPKEK